MALVPGGRGKLVLKVDMLVEGTDMPRSMTYRQAARKAVAMCVSDFAAKGVRPTAFMASVGLRRGTTMRSVKDLARGFRDAEDEWGVPLVGGDTNESKELVVDCAMAGFAERATARSGARRGDLLVCTGDFGLEPSGIAILDDGARSNPAFRARAVGRVLTPSPDMRLGLALAPLLSASMDSSDGLARSVHTLSAASAVGFEVETLPAAPGVQAFARANGLDAKRLVLGGGEEYCIVGTVPRRRLAAAQAAAEGAGGRLRIIGRAAGSAGAVLLREGKDWVPVRNEGWTHLG